MASGERGEDGEHKGRRFCPPPSVGARYAMPLPNRLNAIAHHLWGGTEGGREILKGRGCALFMEIDGV